MRRRSRFSRTAQETEQLAGAGEQVDHVAVASNEQQGADQNGHGDVDSPVESEAQPELEGSDEQPLEASASDELEQQTAEAVAEGSEEPPEEEGEEPSAASASRRRRRRLSRKGRRAEEGAEAEQELEGAGEAPLAQPASEEPAAADGEQVDEQTLTNHVGEEPMAEFTDRTGEVDENVDEQPAETIEEPAAAQPDEFGWGAPQTAEPEELAAEQTAAETSDAGEEEATEPEELVAEEPEEDILYGAEAAQHEDAASNGDLEEEPATANGHASSYQLALATGAPASRSLTRPVGAAFTAVPSTPAYGSAQPQRGDRPPRSWPAERRRSGWESGRPTVFEILTRYWLLVLLPAVILAAAGAEFALNRPATYTAEARLSVGKADPTSPAFGGFVTAAAELAGVYSRAVNTPSVVGPVSSKLHLAQGTVSARLSATPIADSPIIRVIGTAPSALAAESVANAGAASLTNYVTNTNRDNPDATRLDSLFHTTALQKARNDQTMGRINRELTSDPTSTNLQNDLSEAQALDQTLSLRLSALGAAYTNAQQSQAATDVLFPLSSAASASSNRSSKVQTVGGAGLLAGLVIGIGLAMWRAKRVLRRRFAV